MQWKSLSIGLEYLYMAVRSYQGVFGRNKRSSFGIIPQGRGGESYLGSGALLLTTLWSNLQAMYVCLFTCYFISALTYLLQVHMRATTPFLSDASAHQRILCQARMSSRARSSATSSSERLRYSRSGVVSMDDRFRDEPMVCRC
jgi:hypothetical protein